MIELDLDKVMSSLVWKLKVLAAMRSMCGANEIDAGWCIGEEQETAELLRSVRRVVQVKGNVLVVKPKR